MAESFYGGRQGAPFLIKKNYSSITEMINDFGSANCSVTYGEYVFIDSKDKDNAKIYRRTNNVENNGAFYIGQILSKSDTEKNVPIFILTDDLSEYNENLIQTGSISLENGNLISGADSPDKINYEYVVTEENDVPVTKMSLKVPYTIIDLEADWATDDVENPQFTLVSAQPFNQKWKLTIPKIELDNDNSTEAFLQDLAIITYNNQYIINLPDSIETGDKLLVYQTTASDTYYFIAIYNTIDNLRFDDATQQLFIKYAYDENEKLLATLKFVSDIKINQNGSLSVKYGDSDYIELEDSTTIKWLESAELTEEGFIEFTYNTTEKETINTDNPIKYITHIIVAENGEVTYKYNDNSTSIDEQKVKWIESIELTENGIFSVKYNVDNVSTQINSENPLKWITNIYIDENDFLIKAEYNNGQSENLSNTPVSFIKEMKINEDYHLLVKYTNNPDEYVDLGSIKDNSGLLIKTNILPSITTPSLTTVEEMIEYLNLNGNSYFQESEIYKAISIGEEYGAKKIFAYDEINETWYYLGVIGDTDEMHTIDIPFIISDTEDENLPIGGLWLQTEESL